MGMEIAGKPFASLFRQGTVLCMGLFCSGSGSYPVKCEMKLLFHSQTSTAPSLKFGKGSVISSYPQNDCIYLCMLGSKLNPVNKGGYRCVLFVSCWIYFYETYLNFLLFLDNKLSHVVKILPLGRQRTLFSETNSTKQGLIAVIEICAWSKWVIAIKLCRSVYLSPTSGGVHMQTHS